VPKTSETLSTTWKVNALPDTVPKVSVPRSLISSGELAVTQLAFLAGLAPTKAEIKRLIDSGGLYVNNTRVTDKQYRIRKEDIVDEKFLLLRSGKKNYKIVLFT